MIKKSRIRITVLIFAALVLLLIATVGIIYLFTSHQLTVRNREMLSRYAEQYWENGNPDDQARLPDGKMPDGEEPPGGKPSDDLYVSSTFNSVAFLSDGSTDITNDQPSLYTDEELVQIAGSRSEKQTGYGTVGSLAYLISEQDGGRLVVLMDNTAMDESKQILLRSTLIYAATAIPILALLSWFSAGWTLRPMEESYKKQKQFIADAGHELKTPISTVNANLELLSRDVGENRWLANIRYENGRMEELVRKFLDLAQLDSVQLPMEPLDFSRLVTAGVLPFESTAFEQGCMLEYEISDGIGLTGNQSQLAQLVSILLDNALGHCNQGGRVRVTLSDAHNKALLAVSNEGAAIPPEQAAHLFERFYRADDARMEHSGHYGLGLSIAKAVTDAHKGKLSVTSENGFVTSTAELPCNLKQPSSTMIL